MPSGEDAMYIERTKLLLHELLGWLPWTDKEQD